MIAAEPDRTVTMTAGRWLMTAIIIPVGAADVWAFTNSRFIPTHIGDGVALILAAMVAVVAALFAAISRAFAPDSSYYQALFKRWPQVANVRMRVATFAVVGFMATFFGAQLGFLDWWTLAAGSEGSRTVTVSSYQSKGRSVTCAGYNIREEPFLWRPAICTQGLSLNHLPAGAPLRLSGRTSAAGIDVQAFSTGH